MKRPWFSKGLKFSKTKQTLCIKFLKNKSAESEGKYKNKNQKIQNRKYKNLFEKLKIKSKKNYYATLLNKYIYDIKQTWQVIKEITETQKEIQFSTKSCKAKQVITKKERNC